MNYSFSDFEETSRFSITSKLCEHFSLKVLLWKKDERVWQNDLVMCVDSLNALIFNICTYSNKCYTISEWILFSIFLHPFIPYPIPQLRTLANRRCKQPVFIPPSKCPRVSSFSELQWRSHRAPIDCLRLLLGSLFANHSSNLDQLFQELVC